MIRITRLEIGELRPLSGGAELTFSHGMNVLLGMNGTGKTRLLKVLRDALSSDFADNTEEFEINYRLEWIGLDGGTATIDVELVQEKQVDGPARHFPSPPRLSTSATVIIDGMDSWFYVTIDDSQIRIRTPAKDDPDRLEDIYEGHGRFPPGMVLGNTLMALNELEPDGPLRPLMHEQLDLYDLRRFDEATDMLAIITGNTSTAAAGISFRFPSFPHGYSRFLPASIAEAIRAKLDQEVPATTIEVTSQETKFLELAQEALGFQKIRIGAQLRGRQQTDDGYEITYDRFSFSITLSDGAIITHDELSYGQKRLLSFLWYLEISPTVVVADELINGLHHDWIARCVQLLDGRQSFLSSQNPLLLDHLSFDSAREAQDTFILCSVDKEHKMAWRNMTADEAADFYSAYSVGIQYVGEILRTKGLW